MLLRIIALASIYIMACSGTNKQTLVWADEFDTPGAPDTTKWTFDLGNNNGWGNNELQYYTRDTRNVRVENGKLVIEAVKDSMGGKPFTSSRVLSKGRGDWLYGRFEIRAKLPRGKGTWPAIWMMPTKSNYGPWPRSGEIDIMEHVGYEGGVVHGTIHCEAYNHINNTQKEGMMTVPDAQDQFHIYALDWTKDKMDFLIDNKVFFSVTRNPKDNVAGWPFDKPFHLILNMAVGGNWGGKQGVDQNIWPQRMEIDYVRVYQ
ncbi:glycoside hydrolase family 16 protein [Chryseolinea lacunae]|uniref:Glycoside hydrolase family 16 protein n=1 Tax=Chryseolinea lacunae TaxID=2801331 RepID=A0ABS1KYR5_9BACT|nr:glycoside hydrolase family 16 protein [Chryseolinea lacunae]MBL0744616.1 glycoside hydrolase family 16 protein [Chryseolinea lacunae]